MLLAWSWKTLGQQLASRRALSTPAGHPSVTTVRSRHTRASTPGSCPYEAHTCTAGRSRGSTGPTCQDLEGHGKAPSRLPGLRQWLPCTLLLGTPCSREDGILALTWVVCLTPEGPSIHLRRHFFLVRNHHRVLRATEKQRDTHPLTVSLRGPSTWVMSFERRPSPTADFPFL